MKLRFYKGSKKPSVPGTIWFNQGNKRIEVVTDSGDTDVYGSDVASASFINNVLTINKTDGNDLIIDLSTISSSTDLENSLASKLDKIQVNDNILDTTQLNLKNGSGISLNIDTNSIVFSTFPFSATEITSGTISLEHLPKGAIERLFVFNSEENALSSPDVSEGDTVQITDNDNKMYFCVSNSGTFDQRFRTYTAGAATSVPWSGIIGKPDGYIPIEHSHTVDQIVDFPTNLSSFANDIGYITSAVTSINGKTGDITLENGEGSLILWLDNKNDWDIEELDAAIANNRAVYLKISEDSTYMYHSKETDDVNRVYYFLGTYTTMASVYKIMYNTSTQQIYESNYSSVNYGDLHAVARSGDYEDLINTPIIPTVPTTISSFRNDVGYLVLDDLTDYAKKTDIPERADLSSYALKSDIPSKISAFSNDSGFITADTLSAYAKTSQLPRYTSDLTNNSGFITTTALNDYVKSSEIPTKTSDLTNDSEFVTRSDIDRDFVTNSSLSDTLSDYAAKTDIPSYDLSDYIKSQDLADYAKKTDIPSVETFLESSDISYTSETSNVSSVKIGTLQVGSKTASIYGQNCVQSFGGQTGEIIIGTGLAMTGNTLSSTTMQETSTTEDWEFILDNGEVITKTIKLG